MDYGGQHIGEDVNVAAEDGGVFEHSSFEVSDPAVDAAEPVQMNLNYPDPLDGKSGKDSLSDEEAVLS